MARRRGRRPATARTRDPYDNRATVHLGGRAFELIASKGAERIYGDRFRFDPQALADDHAATPVTASDPDGNQVVQLRRVAYTGRLKVDLLVTANMLRSHQGGRGDAATVVSRLSAYLDYPVRQLMAATWAMAKAAGSTKLGWDEWEAWTWTLPSSAKEDEELWRVVCVDLLERAFFRGYEGAGDAREPDDDDEGAERPADAPDGRGDLLAGAGRGDSGVEGLPHASG